MSLVCPNVSDFTVKKPEEFLTYTNTGSFLFIFLGIDTFTVIILLILSIPSSPYLAIN